MLQIDPPEFAHLPLLLNNRGQKLSKRFGDVSVESYRDRGFLPEALLNGIALLGWNPPHRDDPSLLAESTGVFFRHEVLSLTDMIQQFNLDKVGKSGAKFAIEKLEYLNAQHIRDRFNYIEGNEEEAKAAVAKWRSMLAEEMPKALSGAISRTPDHLLLKVMDLMKVRMRYLADI